jgi:ComF family protein
MGAFASARLGVSGATVFARAIATWLLPATCVACRIQPLQGLREGGVCAHCWAKLPLRPERVCVRCDERLEAIDEEQCGRCRLDPPEFSKLRAAVAYVGTAREILLAFKFRGADYLDRHLARIMVERLRAPEADAVVAVPPRRRLLPADHAADKLGNAVAAHLGLPFSRHTLIKRRQTLRQSGLSVRSRADNVRGAFAAESPVRRVLLVDDVATSGATARECARVLLRSGAESVVVWCFARASRLDGDA